MKRRVLVLGLDAAPPELLFKKFLDELPNLSELIKSGIHAPMRSCHPPITIPAWMVMMTGKSPGRLGLYGFRHRKPGSYAEYYIANSLSIKEPAVWDIAGKQGLKSCLVSIPPSYPPKPVNGWLISCFITPSAQNPYTYPRPLKLEIQKLVGDYIFDVEFRTEQRHKLLRELYEMTAQHFKVINYLAEHKPWDFFMFVEIGLDRVQHAFWKFFDPEHHLYVPNSEFATVIEDYYKFLDQKIGELLKKAGDNLAVIVVSDHGAKRMKGAFCINQWLAEEGLLALKKPEQVVDLEKAKVDWEKTIAWGWGGYYARIFLNVKGREPKGVIPPEDYESMRDEIADRIKGICDEQGRPMKNIVLKPEEIYPVLNGDPPDLMVYFDDLYWRSAGTVGHPSIYLPENDKGPDDAVHSFHGVFAVTDMEGSLPKMELSEISILDIAPTILKLLGLEVPEDLEGRPLPQVS